MRTSARARTAVPSAIHLPGLSEDEDRLLNRLLDQLRAKMPRNLLRAAYYDGKRQVRQASPVIPPQYFNLGVIVGWSAKAVDILAQRCNLDGFYWAGGDISELGVDEVWVDNMLGVKLYASGVSTLIHACAFLITTEGAEGEPDVLIHVKDAMNATGDWNDRLSRMDNLLSITSRDTDGEVNGMVLYLDGETIEGLRVDGKWTTERTEHQWHVPVEPLVYKRTVERPMGTSRISRVVMGYHDAAMRTMIRMEGHADVFSFPEMWMLGADSSVFKNADGSVKPAWQVMLGRIKGIPDDDEQTEPSLARADIKQFQAASPQPHIDQLKAQAQQFAGETSIPLTSLGVSDMTNPTSAESYIASREDLIALAEQATENWTPALQRTICRALAMKNGLSEVPAEWAGIGVRWRNPVYLSRAAQADAGMKQLTADPSLVGTEVGYELLGLDSGQISRVMASGRRNRGNATVAALAAAPPPQQGVKLGPAAPGITAAG
jgi:hypothetical protein